MFSFITVDTSPMDGRPRRKPYLYTTVRNGLFINMESKYRVTLITQQELNKLFNSHHVVILSNPYRGNNNLKERKKRKG